MKNKITIEYFWETLNQKLNMCIGKLTVPAMTNTHPLTKEVHSELLEMAHWIDESLEELTTPPLKRINKHYDNTQNNYRNYVIYTNIYINSFDMDIWWVD